jgi:hypothetical protein
VLTASLPAQSQPVTEEDIAFMEAMSALIAVTRRASALCRKSEKMPSWMWHKRKIARLNLVRLVTRPENTFDSDDRTCGFYSADQTSSLASHFGHCP